MITRQSCLGRPVIRACRASAPLMLLTANQPTPATIALSPDGRMLPRKPKPVRLSTIWHKPSFGPQVDSTRLRDRAGQRADDDGEHASARTSSPK